MLVIAIMGYLLWQQPNFSSIINAITNFWNSIFWFVVALIILFVAWKLNLFKALRIGG